MKQQKKRSKKSVKAQEACNSGACSKDMCKGGAIYGLGFLGAAVYYIQAATGFWAGALGILKAIIWPAFLTYDAMKFFGM